MINGIACRPVLYSIQKSEVDFPTKIKGSTEAKIKSMQNFKRELLLGFISKYVMDCAVFDVLRRDWMQIGISMTIAKYRAKELYALTPVKTEIQDSKYIRFKKLL